MNKNTKIWLNYLAGSVLSVLLLWSIYHQVHDQLRGIGRDAWQLTGSPVFLMACIALMFINTSLEAYKWRVLIELVEPAGYGHAVSSYLSGMAISVVTPNRMGEYPGRILQLGRTNTYRYIHVAVLGVTSQIWSTYLFGLAGLVYFNMAYPGPLPAAALILCLAVNILAAIIYYRFEQWIPMMERIRWLRKFVTYGRLMKKVTVRKQWKILGISMLRYLIFTAQFVLLLAWFRVDMPPAAAFLMAALFFWVMAVIPTVALTELGIRGQVSILLFSHLSGNSLGIVAATTGLWMLNLIVPATIGSILMLRMRLLR